MRSLKAISFLVLIPLATACATAHGSGGGQGGSDSGAGGTSSSGRESGVGGRFAGSGPTGATSGGPSATSGGPSGATSGGPAGATSSSSSTSSGSTSASSSSASSAASSAGSTSASSSAQSSSAASSSSGGSGGPPANCQQAFDVIGCCDANTLYYCTGGQLQGGACPAGTQCGWNDVQSYYDCVLPPGAADPSGVNPMQCGGGSSSSSSSSSSASSASSASSSSGGGPVTWTMLYMDIFGPSGTSDCSLGGGCHTASQSGFKCGSTKTACYNGFVNSGYVTTGANAPSSPLVDPNQSPLCGSLGGNMPKQGSCITAKQLGDIQSWLASGAPNN